MICDLNGSSYVKHATRKKSKKKKPNPWFFQFGRLKSHALTIQILETLGFSAEVKWNGTATDSDRYLSDVFSSIPTGPVLDSSLSELKRIQALAILSKNDDVNFGIDKEAAAYETFLASEESCRVVNDLLAKGVGEDMSRILFYAQEFISKVLGPVPSFADLDFNFGPGAVLGVTSNKTTPKWKLSPDVTLTRSMLPLVEELRCCMPGWLASPDTRFIFETGRLEFVAKSWKTLRSIMITGNLNAVVQRGYGVHMKRKLMLAGINLSTGQSKHRALARDASVNDNWSTVDLSAASDSIAYMLVMHLLPFDWFCALDAVRDREVTYRGTLLQLQKFSAMGCGFTFELETLLFWGLINGICRLHKRKFEASVYGDDIIVRPDVAQLLEVYFPLFGFNLNKDKTFISGKFKESCGGDFFNGVDVRPFFQKSLRFGGRFTYHGICSMHNFMVRKPWFDPDRAIRNLLLAAVPEDLLIFGPDGYGDGHFLDEDGAHNPVPVIIKDQQEPYYLFKTHVAVPYRDKTESPANLLTIGSYYAQGITWNRISEKAEWHVTRLPSEKRMRAKTTRIRVLQREFVSFSSE